MHPEIRNKGEVEIAITDPNFIAKDKNVKTTENYYRKCQDPLLPEKKYTKVCVTFSEEPASIVSAFGVDKVHKGDTILWTK